MGATFFISTHTIPSVPGPTSHTPKPSLAYGLTHHTTPLQRYEVDETWRDDTHT